MLINKGIASVRHLVDHVDLGDDGLPPGDLHQGSDVTDRQTNQEVHDHDREQQDIRSKEQVGSALEVRDND